MSNQPFRESALNDLWHRAVRCGLDMECATCMLDPCSERNSTVGVAAGLRIDGALQQVVCSHHGAACRARGDAQCAMWIDAQCAGGAGTGTVPSAQLSEGTDLMCCHGIDTHIHDCLLPLGPLGYLLLSSLSKTN